MMTRKHFKMIADTLLAVRPKGSPLSLEDQIRIDQMNKVAISLMNKFSLENPRFNSATFMRACGLD